MIRKNLVQISQQNDCLTVLAARSTQCEISNGGGQRIQKKIFSALRAQSISCLPIQKILRAPLRKIFIHCVKLDRALYSINYRI